MPARRTPASPARADGTETVPAHRGWPVSASATSIGNSKPMPTAVDSMKPWRGSPSNWARATVWQSRPTTPRWTAHRPRSAAASAATGPVGCTAIADAWAGRLRHLPRSNGRGVGSPIPPLAGQPAGYLARADRAVAAGRRRTDPGQRDARDQPAPDAWESAAVGLMRRRCLGPGSPEFPAGFRAGRRADPRSDASAPQPRAAALRSAGAADRQQRVDVFRPVEDSPAHGQRQSRRNGSGGHGTTPPGRAAPARRYRRPHRPAAQRQAEEADVEDAPDIGSAWVCQPSASASFSGAGNERAARASRSSGQEQDRQPHRAMDFHTRAACRRRGRASWCR